MFEESYSRPHYYFEHLDLTHASRVYVVGDIHGCFSLLEHELKKLHFNKEIDHLISVGDLVDRGPESDQALHYMSQPWFHNVLGNHEVMPSEDPYLHFMNGGQWLNKFDGDTQKYYRAELLKAPLILEVKAPNGKLYGFTHATYPTNDWNDARSMVDKKIYQDICLWDRDMLRSMRNIANNEPKQKKRSVANVAHVYHGHTPMKEKFTFGNRTWLDTGAFATGVLTILEFGNDY